MSACTKYIRQQTKESQITDFMMAKHLRLLLILLLGAVTSCKTTQQIPQQPTGKEAKREFRGAWIQTAFQGEYKDMTPAQMRKELYPQAQLSAKMRDQRYHLPGTPGSRRLL